MQAVIGGYQSSLDAERAVRRLELEQFSIQDVIVADRRHRVWRKLSRWYDRRTSGGVAEMPVVVVMTGRPEDVERAGHLLSPQVRHS